MKYNECKAWYTHHWKFQLAKNKELSIPPIWGYHRLMENIFPYMDIWFFEFLFFPFWLPTSLSHPMAIYSANEIRTFFFVFLEKYCQNLSIIQNKQIWNMCIAFWWCNSIHNCPPGCSTYFIWWLERCRLAFMWLMMHNTIFE